MAVGDAVSELTSIAASSYMTIQPSGTAELVIHNLYHEAGVTVEFYDGTNSLIFATEAGAGAMSFCNFHVTNAHYLRIKNSDSSNAKLIGYDGIITRT